MTESTPVRMTKRPERARCHARRFQSPAVMPDIFNRESTSSPTQGHTNKGTEEKNTGFPLTTGGNDRGGPAGMTKGPEQAFRHAPRLPLPLLSCPTRSIPPLSCPMFSIPRCHARRFQSPAVMPDIFNRESTSSPTQGHTNKGTEEKNTGFPLTTGGNDRGGPAGMTKGPEQAFRHAPRLPLPLLSCPTRSIPPLSCPMFSIPRCHARHFQSPFCHSRHF